MSFRAEQNEAKNLEYIHIYDIEILRFALNDNLCQQIDCNLILTYSYKFLQSPYSVVPTFVLSSEAHTTTRR